MAQYTLLVKIRITDYVKIISKHYKTCISLITEKTQN